jgi:hypothetical protein
MLSTKLHAASSPIAQQLPKERLIARGRLPQESGEFDRLNISHELT